MALFFARLLAANGAKVIAAARRIERLEELVREIEAANGKAIAVRLDVTDSGSVSDAFDVAQNTFGVVDIVSNNAGVVDAKMAVDIDEESWDFVLDTNLKGAWLVAREAGMRMIAAGKAGVIVNTASILGLRVALATSSYAASKAALISLTQSLALEWSRKNIRVNALCPGYFVTELNVPFFETEEGRQYLTDAPAGRSGRIEGLGPPFMLLASDTGSFINGIALPVDGAHSIANM